LDVLSFFEGALLDEARHPRDDIDLIDRGEASDVIDGFRHLPAHHWRDRNRGRRRSALGGGDAAGGRDAQRANGGFPSMQSATRHRVLLTAGTMFASGCRRSATAYTCAKPPSTNSSAPVTSLLSSDARNTTALEACATASRLGCYG